MSQSAARREFRAFCVFYYYYYYYYFVLIWGGVHRAAYRARGGTAQSSSKRTPKPVPRSEEAEEQPLQRSRRCAGPRRQQASRNQRHATMWLEERSGAEHRAASTLQNQLPCRQQARDLATPRCPAPPRASGITAPGEATLTVAPDASSAWRQGSLCGRLGTALGPSNSPARSPRPRPSGAASAGYLV